MVKPEVKGNSYFNDYLSFRFNTSAPDGTILHTLTGTKDIFILELVNGTLVMQIDLGRGKTNKQLLDQVEQDIVICQWRAHSLYNEAEC